MAFRVEIRPPDGSPYSLTTLFVDYLAACDEGSSYRYAPLFARFDVRKVDDRLAENHFEQRTAFEATQPAISAPDKPVATDVLVHHYVRSVAGERRRP